VTPYALEGIPSVEDNIQPVYAPAIQLVEIVEIVEIADTTEVILHLWDTLTPDASYVLHIENVVDVFGNLIASSYPFSSWPFSTVDRDIVLWDTSIPELNKEKDTSRHLERMIACINEAFIILLNDVDLFKFYTDKIKQRVLPILATHLGNPFSFFSLLPAQQQHDVLSVLVKLYQEKGTATGIENSTLLLLNKEVTVIPWEIPESTWQIGISELGFNSYLGPSRAWYRYAFALEHAVTFTEDDYTRITEIVRCFKPAHTHFIGFVYTGI
jgi:phage tail-like protein